MNARTVIAKPVSWIRRQVGRISFDNRTREFLRSRNVRVVVQEAGSENFHAFALKPKSDIFAFGRELHMEIKILDATTAWVSVYDNAAHRPLIGVQVPFDSKAGTLNLDFKDIFVKLMVDAEPVGSKIP